MNFTDEQKKAIEERGNNILVSAAAGSGKTAVLVERIYGLITGENAVDVDRLLVVTFTRAAAAEMKERVRKRLDKALESDPLNDNLLRQETLLHNAQITTIDSFCNYILRENFTALEIDPQYRIADAGELKLMAEEVLEQMLEELFEEEDENFLHCCNYFTAGETMEGFKEYIRQLYRTAQSLPDPEGWLEEKPWKKTDMFKLCLEHAKRILREMLSSMEQALALCDEVDGPAAYAETIAGEAAYYAQALSRIDTGAPEKSFDALREALSSIEYARLKTVTAKSGTDPLKKDTVKNARDQAKKRIQALISDFFRFDAETVLRMEETATRASDELCDIVLRYMRELDAAKRDKNIFDFNDIEHLALKALTEKETDENGNVVFVPSKVALAYREHFAEVMIDEYQDSNLIQEVLLDAIAGDGKRFMVGDVKQSIYRFRLARPEIFMEKLSDYAKEGDGAGRRIDLHQNFRSRAQVLNLTNSVFEKIMARDLGGVDYDADAMLVRGRDFVNDKDLSETKEGEASPYACELLMTENVQSKDETEAALVAAQILELMKTLQVEETDKLTDEKRMRPLCFKDIVILMRTTAGRDEVYRKALEENNIPVYVESKAGFFAANEVLCILNLLSVLNNPLQDIPFVGVMHSAIGRFSDAELAMIRAWGNRTEESAHCVAAKGVGNDVQAGTGNAEPLADEIKSNKQQEGEYFSELSERFAAAELPSEKDNPAEMPTREKGMADIRVLQEKVRGFLKQISFFREQAVHLSVSELLQLIYDETGYFDNVCAMPHGERRSTNLLILLEKAKAYEQSSYRGLHRFIRYIELLKEYREDEGEANVLDENADVVRIMTIHKSKGLQFPVVFVSNLSGRFNIRDFSGNLITDADLGPASVYIDTEKGFKLSTLRQKIIAQSKREAAVGEELRILYVAMTRAEEKLILTTTAKEPLQKEEAETSLSVAQSGVLPYTFRNSVMTYKDFVLAALTADPVFLQMTEKKQPEEESLLSPDGNLFIRYLHPKEEVFEETLKHADYAERRRLFASVRTREVDAKIRDLLRDRFSFSYVHDNYRRLFTKTTVTELKEALRDEGDDVSVQLYGLEENPDENKSNRIAYMKGHTNQSGDAYVPSFMREGEMTVPLSGAARGILYHKIMELMDASLLQNGSNVTEEEIAAYYAKCEEKGRLPAEWKEAVELRDIRDFLQTELAARMARAMDEKKLKRESQFMMGIPARELDTDLPEHEILLIQGIIDCWFEEEDKLVIADYKTDHVRDEKELSERYRTQLDYYERALKQITGKEVKERILYSFALGREIIVH